jgi:hypothetical protein
MISEESEDSTGLQKKLIDLRRRLEVLKAASQLPPWKRLTEDQLAEILEKTGGKCPICGGEINQLWERFKVRTCEPGLVTLQG